MTEKHSAIALAFFEVVRDVVARGRFTPTQLGLIVIVIESGNRPRTTTRGALAADLREAALLREASILSSRKLQRGEVLVWCMSDAGTGLIAVPIVRPRTKGPVMCELPGDDVLEAIMVGR